MAHHRLFFLAVLALASCSPGDVFAQEPENTAPSEAASKEPAGAAPKREQTIYIPYTKLREVFEKEGRGVFVPYEQFIQLWRAAPDKQPPGEAPPPVSALLTEVENEATVEQQVMRVKARIKIDVLATGWTEIPLRLADSAVTSARIGTEPARLVFRPDTGYALLVENKTKKPTQVLLELEYVKAFTKAPGQNSVSFQSPQAPVSRWRIRLPGAGVKVNIDPLIATTEVPADVKQPDQSGAPATAEPTPKPMSDTAREVDKADETIVLAFVGAAPTVAIQWTPKAAGASGLSALANVEVQQEVTVEENLVRTRAQLSYTITRAELAELVVEVPADQKVVSVFDANVRQWDVSQKEGVQRIVVRLYEPARNAQTITVELEKVGSGEQAAVSIPSLRAMDVARQQGVLVIALGRGLRAEATKRTGLTQLDMSELPPPLAQRPWTFAYRYAALPYELALDVKKLQPRVEVDELVEAYLEPEQLTLDLTAVYHIERAGLFELQVDIPPGYEVREVGGAAIKSAAAAQVDTHRVEGPNKTRLVVNLSREALGHIGLFVELQKRLEEPSLLTPTEKQVQLDVGLVRVAPDSIERTTGRAIVYAPESLRANLGELKGLRPVSFTEAQQALPSSRRGRFAELRPVQAYAFTKQPASLAVSAQRRKPYVSAGQLLVARIEAGLVKYEATFFYDIRYSGVKALRIDVPAELAPEIRNVTSNLPEKPLDPQPRDVAKGDVAWQFTGETELAGNPQIKLTWERRIDKLDVGKSVDLTVPRLNPRNIDRAWGQIVLVKAENIDVLPGRKSSGLRPIDPQHDLMPGASVADAARAFEFYGDWDLAIRATQYNLEEVKSTSIERALVRMVITRSDQVAVQALFRMRSAGQRLGLRLPHGVEFDTQPVRINGKSVPLERGDKDDYFVPLVGRSSEEPLLMELRYTYAGGGNRLELPQFPGEPAIQRVYLSAYLPDEQKLLGYRGPWTEEWYWSSRQAIPLRSDSDLISWASEGVAVDTAEARGFPAAGKSYLFSTLKPAGGPDAALTLVTLHENVLAALVFVAIAIVGLLLVNRPYGDRLLVVGLMFALVVLLGVFTPTLTRQILGTVLWVAVATVVLLWLLFDFRRWQARGVTYGLGGWSRKAATASTSPTGPTPPENVPAPSEPPPPEPPREGEEGRRDG